MKIKYFYFKIEILKLLDFKKQHNQNPQNKPINQLNKCEKSIKKQPSKTKNFRSFNQFEYQCCYRVKTKRDDAVEK